METVLLSRRPGPFIIPQGSPCDWLPLAQQTLFHSLSKSHLFCQVIHRGSPDSHCHRIQTHMYVDMLTSCLAHLPHTQLIFSKPSPPPGDLLDSPHLTVHSSPVSLPMNTGVRSIVISQGISLSLITSLAPATPWESMLGAPHSFPSILYHLWVFPAEDSAPMVYHSGLSQPPFPDSLLVLPLHHVSSPHSQGENNGGQRRYLEFFLQLGPKLLHPHGHH